MKKPSKGLGSGLGALLGEGVFEEENGSTLLPLSRVEPRPDQPRSQFDEEALSELADSIARHGLIQPITVRRMPGGYYQIVAGERRWRACRMAGLTEIPAHVIDADDAAAMELALVENLQREDLNPIEEGNGYRTLMEQYGLTQAEVAQRVGKSRPAVANALRLLALPEASRALVESGRLGYSQARALLELKDGDLIDEGARRVAEKDLTARETALLVQQMLRTPRKKTPAKKAKSKIGAVDYAAVLSEKLTRSLGRRVTVSPAKKGGSVTLDYYDNEDLEALTKLLCGGLPED